MKNVNSSSLPAIISRLSTIFEKSEKMLKFIVGPTKLKPGPTFPTQVITAEMEVRMSKPFKAMTKLPTKITNIYRKMKFVIL